MTDPQIQGADAEARRLRELLGAPGQRPEPLSDADEAILARILASPQEAPSQVPARRGAPTWLRALAVAAAVAGIVVAGVSWQSRSTPAEAGPPPSLQYSGGTVAEAMAGTLPPAHDTLTAIAASAGTQPVVTGSGIQRIRSYAWYLSSTAGVDAVLFPTFGTLEVSPDGSAVSKEVRAPALGLGGLVVDEGRYPRGGAVATTRTPAGTFDADRAADLPRDPAALRAALVADGGDTCTGAEPQCIVSQIVRLYGTAVVPSDLSQAIWTVLADESAVQDLGTTRDRVGRAGDAVALRGSQAGDDTVILVIDPTTGQLLSWENVNTAFLTQAFDEPSVISFQAITSAEWVPAGS
ncbi:hypothetical protein [Cellulomonas rhizosphaerae]|uniref:Uncharacterized protein n=1 Tax=Cellulomonas rhizosphaerae TaxID=2293719 RepID=A0A413RNQ0_9CELL|nr:hypothetical protein [Cellulomonas rhizosphaerae]RHA43548.1 hypothetical protein D1825_05825 [Cellulomonas rhizosphaerae]